MEAQASLIGTDGTVHLHAKSAMDLHATLIVEPGHAKDDHALGLHHPLQDAGRAIFRMFFQDRTQRLQHLLHGLMKFCLGWIFGFYLGENILDIPCRISVSYACPVDFRRHALPPARELQLPRSPAVGTRPKPDTQTVAWGRV